MIRGEIRRKKSIGVFIAAEPGGKIYRRVVKTMRKIAIWLQRYVKTNKLSGQVLKVRTGNLRRSIKQQVIESRQTHVIAVVSTNVNYGRVHEYGYTGTVNVGHFWREGKNGSVMVKEHTRKVRLPKRSFLRSALRETASHTRSMLKQGLRGN